MGRDTLIEYLVAFLCSHVYMYLWSIKNILNFCLLAYSTTFEYNIGISTITQKVTMCTFAAFDVPLYSTRLFYAFCTY